MYSSVADPYCYPGTSVLINKLGLRDRDALDAFEVTAVSIRQEHGLPKGKFDAAHFRGVHRHLFIDVYDWAGDFRSIRIAKGSSMFCYPENIEAELAKCLDWLHSKAFFKGLELMQFATSSAHFLAELNAVHAFREGNGRTQLTFFAMLARDAGYPVNIDIVDAKAFLSAMIASFAGNERLLRDQLVELCSSSTKRTP